MNKKPKNLSETFTIRKLVTEDFTNLENYFRSLSSQTKNRYRPHGYELHAIYEFYKDSANKGYIIENGIEIISYAAVRLGFLEHDIPRLSAYDLNLSQHTDCAFAPSVSDAWQGKGLGKKLLAFVTNDLKQTTHVNRMILWGGVKKENEQAVNYYRRNGFQELGEFEYEGWNLDMLKEI